LIRIEERLYMLNPLSITFKDVEHDKKIEQLIESKFNKLKQLGHDITKCHIFVEKLSKNHQKGNIYRVKLNLKQSYFPDIFISENMKEGELSFENTLRRIFKKAQELIRKKILKRKQAKQFPVKSLIEEESV